MSRGTVGGQRLPAPAALRGKRDNIIRTLPVKAGESVAAGDVVDVVGGQVTTGKVQLGTLAVGSTITLNVDGAPREWIVVHRGKPSSIYSSTFTGKAILMLKDIYEERAWHSAAVNSYSGSSIHTYLNNTFLAKLDADVRSAVAQVKIPYRAGSGTSSVVTSGENGLAAKVWLPSGYELGWTRSDIYYLPQDGAKFDYFSAGKTSEANALRIGYLSGAAKIYWMRSPYASSDGNAESAVYVTSNGAYSFGGCTAARGIRPCMALPDSYLVYGDADARPSQAIALQSGSGGQSVQVIYDGVAELAGVTAGTGITSPGVQGYAPMDGLLWVRPEWETEMGVRIEAVSYVGTGSYGASNPTSLTFRAPVEYVIIVGYLNGGKYNPLVQNDYIVYRNPTIPCCMLGSAYLNQAGPYSDGSSTDAYAKISADRKTVTWYNAKGGTQQLNDSNCTYYCIGFCKEDR